MSSFINTTTPYTDTHRAPKYLLDPHMHAEDGRARRLALLGHLLPVAAAATTLALVAHDRRCRRERQRLRVRRARRPAEAHIRILKSRAVLQSRVFHQLVVLGGDVKALPLLAVARLVGPEIQARPATGDQNRAGREGDGARASGEHRCRGGAQRPAAAPRESQRPCVESESNPADATISGQ